MATASMAHTSDNLESLVPSLELAVKSCMAQLHALRISGADKQSPTYSAEERVLKLTLNSLLTQLQTVREAGKAHSYKLLLAVLPGALQLLNTSAVLPLAQTSPAVRACLGAGERRSLVLPHLDAAPASPLECEHFFAECIALGSVRSVVLPAMAACTLLKEHAASLSSLDSLVVPQGCLDFTALPLLPSLRRLGIDARSITDSSTLARLTASLLGLPRPLYLLRVIALDPALMVPLLEAIMSGGLAHQLTFQQCKMPDIAVARICSALLQSGGLGVPLLAVRFEECGLSEHAEQHLLATLEQCDGRCRVTIDGGMARQNLDDVAVQDEQYALPEKSGSKCTADLGSSSLGQECTQTIPNSPPSSKEFQSMPLQEMLAMALVRLQEEKVRLNIQQVLEQDSNLSAAPGECEEVGKTQCGGGGDAQIAPAFTSERLCTASGSDSNSIANMSQPRRSRFGFALDDSVS
jgi:hypothetical protein